ncbi:ATP-binding protein [Bdellovibrionota bacterium FG-2]
MLGNWDCVRIEQVVLNLLTNAMKYGAGKPIEISVRKEQGLVRLSVRDHGIGIAIEDQKGIFERFERAVSAKAFGGFGLGLFITRSIVEAHCGSSRVESELGQGSCFIVELPLKG